MKSKFLTLVALGFAMTAQAANINVYITGSTAGRASIYDAIQQIFPAPITITKDNATLNNAGRANFVKVVGADTYTIYTSWSGSATGVGSLVNNSNVAFMVAVGGTTENPTTTSTFNHTADIAFSDVFQSSTPHSAVPLNDFTTIVLPFKFFTSEGSPITNVTPQLAQYLYIVGSMPLALFTGDSAHETHGVIATGRDSGSGTRITTMAETGVGAFSNVVQYTPTVAGTLGANVEINGTVPNPLITTLDSPVVTHAGGVTLVVNQPIRGPGIPPGAKVLTVDSTTQFTMTEDATASQSITVNPTGIRGGQNVSAHTNVGNGGSNSGGTVAGYVAATTEGLSQDGRSPCYYLSYLGVSDGNTAILNGAVECQYNGVTYTPDNVRNGRYSLWGYLHLMTRPDVNSDAEAFASQLTGALDGFPGTSGLKLSTMRVSRLADGGLIVNEAY